MKKILLVATVQSHIAQFHRPLIELCKENNCKVEVAAKDNLVLKPNLKLKHVDKVYDIPFERSPFKKNNFRSYKKLKSLIEINNYDVVHCNTPVGGVIARLAVKNSKLKTKPKIIYTAHGFHFYKGSSIKNWVLYYPVEKYFAKYTDKLITITEEDYLVANKKFHTKVYHQHGVGVDPRVFYEYSSDYKLKLKKQLGFKESDIIILNVGELNNNKNQETIIKSMIQLKKVFPNIKLVIAGNGPKEDYLKDLVKKHMLTEQVKFLGYVRGLESYYNISNVTVSASFREGLPLNIIESIFCNVPVVASDNRGHRELLPPDSLIDNISDPSSYVGLISNAIIYPDNYKIGDSINKYTVENVISELESIYYDD